MSEPISDNRRIAKNTVFLYARMLLSTLVSLYTSRVVLQVLGVEDYGVYGVVGGIVGMFFFLNSAMAGATSRFLTFELGRGYKDRLKATFSSAMIVHIGIALVIFLLADSVGLWFLHHKLVIPDGRMDAANWVLQCSIISMFFTVTQVPYNATIISHEKMNVYAYVELLNVFLKLGIVYALSIGNFDKLKLYAVLMLGVSIFIAATYRSYCRCHYEESHFHWTWDKDILKPMLNFSGWDLYGNMCVTARQQGSNFVINIFGGAALNASSSIATTVNGIIIGLSNNVTMAFRPQIVKEYSQGNIGLMSKLACSASEYSILLFGCLMTPLMLEMPYVMRLWLSVVPAYSVEFCQLLMIAGLFSLINTVLVVCIHATGNIKKISLITGSLYLLTIPALYFMLKVIPNPIVVYIIMIISNVLIVLSNLYIVGQQIIGFNTLRFVKESSKAMIILIVSSIVPIAMSRVLLEDIDRLLMECIANVASIAIMTFFIVLDKEQKNKVFRFIVHH